MNVGVGNKSRRGLTIPSMNLRSGLVHCNGRATNHLKLVIRFRKGPGVSIPAESLGRYAAISRCLFCL